jgi:hypothetical protein
LDAKKLMRTLTVGSGTILVPHIDAYQARAKFPPTWTIIIENEKEKDDHFHPSTDCFADVETLYRAKKGQLKPSPISPALRRTFDAGHMWHRYIQNILIDMGFVSPDNVERPLIHEIKTVYGKATCKGTADLVDVRIPGNGYWLVDIKTMGKEQFGAPDEEMMRKYFAQVNCYGDWLGTDKMMILAICKDSPHDFREFIVPRDQATLDEIYERWTFAQYCIDNNVSPSMLSSLERET